MKGSALNDNLKKRVSDASRQLFQVDLEQVSAEAPARDELGDLAFPVAFDVARRIKQATGERRSPRDIAERIKPALEDIEGVARVEVAGAGYLNVFFDRALFLSNLRRHTEDEHPASTVGLTSSSKSMVEHTSINPNKAAHIGHVRNAVLGDTFARILRAAGERVEVQNYIDNTGVQVADVVVGFLHLEKMSLEMVKALDSSLGADRPFDYYCWDLYTRVGIFYRNGDPDSEINPELLKLRIETLHAIEEGDNPTAALADYVAMRNVERILDTMERLGIYYDLLPRESEILSLQFWARAFERMKLASVIHLENEGKHKGCWVMPFESHTGTGEHEADKIIVRSNGTVTYTGKDIAYQLWKLGRLGLDFYYRLFRFYDGEYETWITSPIPIENERGHPPPEFGRGSKVYNVIDSRQAYTQEVVKRGVMGIVPEIGADAGIHVSYEMVSLTPTACDELGIELTAEERLRPFIEMSGRKGRGVKADDLINRLEENALREVEARQPAMPVQEKLSTAHSIAVGALRYFLLKFTRTSVIAFDFKEALSFEGEAGPYCQYAAVRANSIFKKLDSGEILEARDLLSPKEGRSPVTIEVNRVLAGEKGNEVWSLLSLAVRLDEVLQQARATAEPAFLAKYTFNLARAFNLFYHRHHIMKEEDAIRRRILILVADIVRGQLTGALAILGISVPETM